MRDDKYVRSRYPTAEAQFHREMDGSREPNDDAKSAGDAAWVVYSQSSQGSRALGKGSTSTEAWQAAARTVAAEQAQYEVQDQDYDNASRTRPG